MSEQQQPTKPEVQGVPEDPRPTPEGVNADLGIFDDDIQQPAAEVVPAAPVKSVEAVTPVEETPKAEVNIPPAQVIEILRQAGQLPQQQAAQPVAAPEPVAPSQEEIEKIFEFFQPSDSLVKKLLNAENPQEVKEALKEMRDGMSRQQLKITQAFVARELKPLQDELTDYREFKKEQVRMRQEAEAAQFETNFYEAHPELQNLKPLVDAVVTKVGLLKGTPKERIEAYAKSVHDTLAASGITVNTPAGTTPPAATARRTTTTNNGGMAALASGGHPGTRQSSAPSKPKTKLEESLAIFDP